MSTFCSDCRIALDRLRADAPCPQCGSMNRTHEVEAFSTISISDSVGVAIEHGPRSWQDRWRTFIHNLDQLRSIYAGTSSANNVEWEQTVRAVLGDAFQLRDYIAADLALGKEAHRWVDGRPNLSLARDFANTDKHYKRENPAHRTVYIKGTSSGTGGNAVTLGVETPGAQMEILDSLDIATGCLNEWRQFRANHGLAEPE